MIKRFIILFVLLLVFSSSSAFILAEEAPSPIYYKEIKVELGDTMYSITKEYNTSNMKTNEYIEAIATFNLKDKDKICVGDTLLLPIYK